MADIQCVRLIFWIRSHRWMDTSCPVVIHKDSRIQCPDWLEWSYKKFCP